MATNSQDALARAYATLFSIRKNIEQMVRDIPEVYLLDYHAALDKLENMLEVSEFRIPISEVRPIVDSSVIPFSGQGQTNARRYTQEKYVDKFYFLTKLDAILTYFEIVTSEKPKSIGFRTPNE